MKNKGKIKFAIRNKIEKLKDNEIKIILEIMLDHMLVCVCEREREGKREQGSK